MLLLLWLACAGTDEAPAPAAEPAPPQASAPQASAPQGGGPGPGPRGKAGGPARPGPAGPPPGAKGGAQSGAALQDPTGFPTFHAWPAPPGPPVAELGTWSPAEKLTGAPGGGYRPQVAVSGDGTLHAVYYERTDAGDLIRHRVRRAGADWSAPQPLGFDELRNWGPDIVAREDGSVVVVFDHAQEDFSSQGFLTTWTDGTWSPPVPLTPGGPGEEVGSGHVADTSGDDLAFVWIGKKMSPEYHFRSWGRWRIGGTWTEPAPFTDGTADAWHTNVERRPDGSVLAAYDVGVGGGETRLFVVDGREGRFSTPEDLSAPPGRPGERAHFAFGADGLDHVTWFHKKAGSPRAVYVRSGRPGAWSGQVDEPSKGLGGFHFDPDIAVDAEGRRVLVWGWDLGSEAELVYSVDEGSGWSAPRRVATIGWGKPGLPSLVVGPDGTFHVVWNQGVRGENHVYYARFTP